MKYVLNSWKVDTIYSMYQVQCTQISLHVGLKKHQRTTHKLSEVYVLFTYSDIQCYDCFTVIILYKYKCDLELKSYWRLAVRSFIMFSVLVKCLRATIFWLVVNTKCSRGWWECHYNVLQIFGLHWVESVSRFHDIASKLDR